MDTLVTILWLGTAGLFISDGKDALLIDPFVTRSGIVRVATGCRLTCDTSLVRRVVDSLGLKNVRGVIVTHSHYDHSMDAPEFARCTGAPLIGSESTLMVGRSYHLADSQMMAVQPKAQLRFGAFNVSFIESRHGPALFGKVPYQGEVTKPFKVPAPAKAYRVGTIFSLRITHGARTMIVHSSAGFKPRMYDSLHTDLLLLGLAGRGNTAEYLEQVVKPLAPATVVSVHYDNFFKPFSAPIRDLFNLKRREFLDAMKPYSAIRLEFPPMCRAMSVEELLGRK